MSAETIQTPRILDEWLKEQDTKERLQRCADEVVKVFNNDLSVRVPRTVELRRNHFESWLALWREKLPIVAKDAFQEAFQHEFPGISQRLPHDFLATLFMSHIWPLVEDQIVAYAIEGIAIPWVRGRLGDAIVIRPPRRIDERWFVPLSLRGHSSDIGTITLDLDGNVIEAETSTRGELLAALNG